MVSTLYNATGEFESGFEWARMAEDQYKLLPKNKPRAVLNQAWSLIALKKLTEASVLVDIVRESIVKSGQETLLAWLNFVTGLIELEEGNLISAASSIEEALKVYETREDLLMQIMFLYYLARIEVVNSDMTTEVFPYLTLLEERAISEDLPGILGQALLLKSEIALLQNDDARLREIVQQLRPLTQEPRMAFLLPLFERLLNRI
jgi:ATP/maltotriose-dependent transcriptional regulator MalT